MMEKTIVVKSSEIKSGTKGDYLQVTATDDKKHNIFDQSLWNLFTDGFAVKLTLEKSGNWMNVVNAESVAKPLAREDVEAYEIAPEQRGMWWKEVGEHIRVGTLKKKAPDGSVDPVGTAIIMAYWLEMMRVLNIKVERKETTKRTEPED